MSHKTTMSRLVRVFLISVLFAFGATDLYAQAAFVLSKHADFSTDDRVFDPTDVLYVQVTAPQIDFNDLDKNEYRLKPDEGGNDIEGAFTNHFNGTYTASIDLITTDLSESDWEWRARIEDDNDNEFEARINITIGTENDDEDDDGGDDEVEFIGTIDAIQSDGLTVDGVFFFVTAAPSIRDIDNNSISFADLAIGMLVEIRGERDDNGDLFATDIKIEDSNDGGDDNGSGDNGGGDDNGSGDNGGGNDNGNGDDNGDEVEFTGTVEILQSNSITVNGITFMVDATTVVLDNNNNPISLDDLAVGLLVEIRGDRIGGHLIATRIKIEDGANDEVEIAGEIESIGDNSITVGGFVFVVTGQTLLLDHNNNPISFGDFDVGMLVEAEGDVQPNGNLMARKIKQEDREDDEVALRGPIESLGSDFIVVEGVTFVINVQTLVLDNNNNPISFGSLTVAQFVEIEGDFQANGTLLARKIKLEDDDTATVEMTGSISRLTSNQIVVSDITFLVDDATEVVDTNNQLLDRSMLAMGQKASVRGTAVTAILVATRIKLLDVNSTTTAIEDADVPTTIELHQNYPNPFNPTTTLSFSLSGAPAPVSLTIYNVLGQKITTLVDGVLPAGVHAYTWNAQDERGLAVTNGLYLYRLQVDEQVLARQMTLLK